MSLPGMLSVFQIQFQAGSGSPTAALERSGQKVSLGAGLRDLNSSSSGGDLALRKAVLGGPQVCVVSLSPTRQKEVKPGFHDDSEIGSFTVLSDRTSPLNVHKKVYFDSLSKLYSYLKFLRKYFEKRKREDSIVKCRTQ